jgi:UDP-glucose:(heptosyl)LPS alpha-1,3-glucosyltransferase
MERQVTKLIAGLVAAQVKVTVVSRTLDLADRTGVRHLRVRCPGRPFSVGYPLFGLIAGIAVWRQRADVIHAVGAVVPNRADVVAVHLCHHGYAQAGGIPRVARTGRGYRLNAHIMATMARWGERWVYRPSRVRALIGVSAGVAHELAYNFPSMADRIRVIPNGVDTEVFFPPVRDSAGPQRTAIFVGGEWEAKGLAIAIDAVSRASGWRLRVVGRGDRYRFATLADELCADVEFLGIRNDVAALYREADAFVLPTAYETFSLVAYEAAASGLPLLIPRVSGTTELIEHGVNGWFVERSATDIADHLNLLAADPGQAAAMATAARSSALAWDWDRMVQSHLELYRELADSV